MGRRDQPVPAGAPGPAIPVRVCSPAVLPADIHQPACWVLRCRQVDSSSNKLGADRVSWQVVQGHEQLVTTAAPDLADLLCVCSPGVLPAVLAQL